MLQSMLEAAWALSNLAAGPHHIAAELMPSAPALISLANSNLSPALAQQCVWGFGNLAGALCFGC